MKTLLAALALAALGALLMTVAAVPLALAVALPRSAGTTTSAPPPTNGDGAVGSPPPGQAVADIPPAMLALYVSAATRCPGLPWTVLAAIGKVETDHARGGQISPAGAEGPMQFMPATWSAYQVDGDGDGTASVWEAADAVPAAADYLCANGGGDPTHLDNAIWHYNHDDAYVGLVRFWAARYSAAAGA